MSLTRQAQLLGLSRASLYYRPAPVSERDLGLMRKIDELHLKFPFAGARLLRYMLNREGQSVGRKHVTTLMRRMSIEALYRQRNTSRPHPEHPVYPYLLRNLSIEKPGQVWATDITYIPMAHGFVYLIVILDWYSRRILAWRLSNSLTPQFCIEALQEALTRYDSPTIFNSDQGSQFTCPDFTAVLKAHAVRISMDGKGCWRDNVFVERLWKTIKYEEVYLHAYDSVSAAKAGLGHYIAFYNTRRPHTALDRRTPDEVYFSSLPLARVA